MSDIQISKNGMRYVTEIFEGIPGDVVVYNPNALHREWFDEDRYKGPEHIGEGHKGRYVPKVGDTVKIKDEGIFEVIDVDPYTWLQTLIPYRLPDIQGAALKDELLGVGPAYPQEGYYCLIDDKVDPLIMTFDGVAYMANPDVHYFRVFVGTNPMVSSEVLSITYNASGEVMGDKIPAVPIEHPDNHGIFKRPDVAWAKRLLDPGSMVRLTGYTASGHVVHNSIWIVNHGSAFKQVHAGTLEIQSVSLVTPYLSEDDERLLIVPNNHSLRNMNPMCRVVYNNGKVRDLPIDGVKVILSGDEAFVPTSPGITQPLNLIYHLDETENFSGTISTVGRFITVHYTIEVGAPEEAYGAKLFVYPEWVSPTRGYKLRSFLQMLDRDNYYEVTDMVEYNVNQMEPFDPLLYGVTQIVSLSLEISKVDIRYRPYRHVQTLWISLMRPGTDGTAAPWLIRYEAQQTPQYGYNVACNLTYASTQEWECDITSLQPNVNEWLKQLYYPTKPMFDITIESGPLVPTHFIFILGGFRQKLPLSRWNNLPLMPTGLYDGAIAVIHWVREEDGLELHLSTSALPIRQFL